MLTVQPTAEMVTEWKRLYHEHRPHLTPNRKSGMELDAYFRSHYLCESIEHPEFEEVVRWNIVENTYSREKLPKNSVPKVKVYRVDNVLVGIDTVTGEFHIESEDLDSVVAIHDDLFRYRGLDQSDLNNFFLVAQYVTLSR